MDKKYKVEAFKINSTGEFVISNMKNIDFNEAADYIQYSTTQTLLADTKGKTIKICTTRGFNRDKIEAMVNKFNSISSKKPNSTLLSYRVECVVKGQLPVFFDYKDYNEIATAITSEQQSDK